MEESEAIERIMRRLELMGKWWGNGGEMAGKGVGGGEERRRKGVETKAYGGV